MQAEGVLEEANEKVSQRDQDIDRLQGSELWLQQQVTNLSRLLATETNLKDRVIVQKTQLQALVERGTPSLEWKEKL
jgi:DNA anti-recombination protein RmuC